MKLTPHFTFDGQSEEALNFYSRALNGQIVSMIRFEEMENQCSTTLEMKPEDLKLILHGSLQFGENYFNCCDRTAGKTSLKGDNIMMDLSLNDREEIQRVFEALAEGGSVRMPLASTTWTSLFGMVVDRYGICWNIMFQ